MIENYAVLNDIHIPYQSSKYYEALKLMKKFPNLVHIYLNGDIGEFESVSAHPKGPKAQQLLLEEIKSINEEFDRLQKMFPGVPVTLIEGNHCYRIFRYIRDVAPQMWGLIQCPDLLRFPDRGWKFVPYGPRQWEKCGKTRDLWLRHEPLVGGGNCIKGTAEKSYVSVMFGHVHQMGQYTHKKIGPEPYYVTAYSSGWLGDINQPCFDYRGSKDNWANGFARVDCDAKTGDYEVKLIRL